MKIKNIHTSKILYIPQKFLGLSLRRPEFHTKISPQLEHYLVLIPPERCMPASIKNYIKWGEENKLHKSQWVNTYCKRVKIPWYSYMYHDSKTRTASGNIVIMMKFRIKRRLSGLLVTYPSVCIFMHKLCLSYQPSLLANVLMFLVLICPICNG